ncbi:hypothetical protein PS15m_008822 [Mucor circinelloides]
MGKKGAGKGSALTFYTATSKNSANTRSICGINLSRLKKGVFRSILWFIVPQDMRQVNNSKFVKKIHHSFKTLLVQFIAKNLLNFYPIYSCLFQNGRDLNSELSM